MHDRYLHWSMPFQVQAPAVPTRKALENQVLEDLASTDNELEKLEILDSYAAYSQRAYRALMVMGFTQQAGRLAETILAPWLREAIPPVHVSYRPARA
ncbi:unnamed protein product, partial [marine sediment metagenome]